MADALDPYRRKRDFAATPEPPPEPGDPDRAGGRFVVQEHHARRLHWDLRLERDGVLVSWAVPRGIPRDPKTNHLAVHVEDHPLSYIDFAGEIPSGSYGAGTVEIWDHGTYETLKFRPNEVMVVLHGERVRGKYVLFQTRGKDWMIHRMDPPEEPGWEPLPMGLRPMLARLAELPSHDEEYAFEIKWDGIRALVSVDGGGVGVTTRTGRDVTPRYPELRPLGEALGARAVLLDGEIVAFDPDGRPSFGRLQQRMQLTSDSVIRRRAREVPVVLMLFDVLHLEGRSLLGLPYTERRELLEGLELGGPAWQTPAYHRGDGAALLELSRGQGLEGVVAKRLDSRYEPGVRTGAWLKLKNHRSQELVIGGWLPGQGGRQGRVGALLVGYHDRTAAEAEAENEPQRLVYAGRVGTGFTEETLERLSEALEPLRRERSPFHGRQPPRHSRWVEPELVAEVEFSEWTHTRTLRAPSFEGLRPDTPARDVVLEGAG
jgi:bifunctional non-homologous end joining protein LigD